MPRGVPTVYEKGTRFGEWTVLEYLGTRRIGESLQGFHLVQCSCGIISEIVTSRLSRGGSLRCKRCADNLKQTYPNLRGVSGIYLSQLESCALKRGIKVEVSLEDLVQIWEKQEGRCALTNLPLVRRLERRSDGTASIDRIDSKLGYCISNIQWVHKDINNMKMDLDQGHFIKMCQLVASNSG